MTHSANDYAADTLGLTLETLEEAHEQAETDEEREAIEKAIETVKTARETVLKREGPTPSQKLVEELKNANDD